ncbi:MAG: hypothetical protein Q8Q16_02545 [Betaproteobacteria bacterium]|nr:hypothetical protein [Betaproteobacteria bacterium]
MRTVDVVIVGASLSAAAAAKRLVDAGFTVGKYFHKEWNASSRMLVLTLAKSGDVCLTMPCKVSGKGEKPIIDITGEAVREAFADFTHVEVVYSKGVIRIVGAS